MNQNRFIIEENCTGYVAFYHNKRGFGFILKNDQSPRERGIFFHISDLAEGIIPESLTEGVAVTFDVAEKYRGFCAKNVKLAEEAE